MQKGDDKIIDQHQSLESYESAIKFLVLSAADLQVKLPIFILHLSFCFHALVTGIELIFFQVAGTRLCFGTEMRIMLATLRF